MVTSVMENEGKSSIAANLAISLAKGGHHVLMIDADIRKPSLHRILNMETAHSLNAALQGKDWKGEVVHSERFHMDVLCSSQALEKVESWGLKALSIQPLPEAKHIFSHVEWHMTGYAVLIDVQREKIKEDFLFVEPERTEREYPVPAAFAAYMEYLNVRLGQERFR